MSNLKLTITALLTVMLSTTLAAQDFDFNEMEYTPEETTFRLFAPSAAKGVKVRIYKQGLGGKAIKTATMRPTAKPSPSKTRQERGTADAGTVWTATVKGDLLGRYYTFDTGYGETPGVFAKAVGVNGRRAAIINDMKTMPDDWCCDERPVIKSPADLVIYELHHRDFSIAHPGARYPGKFLALTEPWAIDHLKQLGVNAVHLLPSFDFGSIDETQPGLPQYNWGYDPVNYNVPEGSYATDATDPVCRIKEFKQMVQALHKAGIAVILDVVYNHTFDIAHSNFQLTFPDYYYRIIAHSDAQKPAEANNVQSQKSNVQSSTFNVQYSNGSGCGNETATEHPMMRRFIIESVKYWYDEYRVDGFRFDLMGCHDLETMAAVRRELNKLNPSILIYGEGWSAGQCALPEEQLAMKGNLRQLPGIAAFSDEMRDALHGPFNDDTKGAFLAGLPGSEESLKFGIVGAIDHPQVDLRQVNYTKKSWALEPTQMVSYVSCHDDMCLTDRLRASIPSLNASTDHSAAQKSASANNGQRSVANGQYADELIRLDLLAQTAVFTSQGIPFMLAGEEMLRTKQGIHNSYNSPDSINHLDWTGLERYPQVFKYYCDLIALRHHHPAFRLGDAYLVRKHLQFLDAPSGVVAFLLKEYAGRDDWRNIIVILNANRTAQQVPIPKGMYTVVCHDGEIDEQSTSKIFGRSATVSPQSALILYTNSPLP